MNDHNTSTESTPPFELNAIGAGLPAAHLVPGLMRQQQSHPVLRAVVVAPPGTGKTTVVPPTISNRLWDAQRAGKVIVTQPRRMAARAGARRLAKLSGTQLGHLVGYTVRGDRKVSADTKVEFVTTGVLLRRLIADPEATGISAVILDEVHERQLDTDVTFALVQQISELRDSHDPLEIVVMSATVDAQFWAELLAVSDGEPASIFTAEAKTFPLQELWAPLPANQRALDARGVTPAFLQHIAQTVRHTYEQHPDGDVLVFLPGAREIDRVAEYLGAGHPAEVLKLLGSTPAAEQDRILAPAVHTGRRRIVLATSVAESALTVSGVRIVVDAGLDRQPRLDTGRGIAGLVTVGAAKSSLIQRAGRAARQAPGIVVRCMSETEFAARQATRPAEIRTADLTQAVLDLASWGATDGVGLRLPEPFPDRAFAAASTTLTQLGALAIPDNPGPANITPLGRRLAKLPVDPRLGRALFDGAEFVGPKMAAEVVAALASQEHADGADLGLLLRRLRADRVRQWVDETARLLRTVSAHADQPASPVGPYDIGLVTALAYPHHIARRRSTGNTGESEYLLASGTAASLPRGSTLHGAQWLAIGQLTLHGDRAIIRAAAELDQEYAELAAGPLLREETRARFVDGKVSARIVQSLGAIELSSTPIQPTPQHTRAAVVADIKQTGVLQFFGTHTKRHNTFENLRARIGVLHRIYGKPWPDMREQALTANLEEWLGPELDQLASGTRVDRVELAQALRRLLPWPEATRFDELAPEHLSVPSGSSVRLDWPEPEEHTNDEVVSPVLAVKLQECFGWTATPSVAQGQLPVVLHLLSPARRPLAVTTDLANFWQHIYPQVRAENRGRYVKHPWPEDPLSAVATAKTNRALRNDK